MSLVAQLERALDFDPARFVAWRAAGETLGWVTPAFAATLLEFHEAFRRDGAGLALVPQDAAARSSVLAGVARALAARGLVRGWRDERYAIASPATGAPLFELERAAMRRFGLPARAAHLNGCARSPGGPSIWVARRSAAKPIDPGELDNMVGGGIASGMAARDALLKECWEEAGIPRELAARAAPAGSLRLRRAVEEGVHDETLIVFDLELEEDFKPANRDGEVSEFLLLEVPELIARLGTGEFTVDAGTVAIDWLERHGLAPPEAELGALLERLREPDPG